MTCLKLTYHYTDHTSTWLSTGLGNIRLSYGRDPETNEVAILKESHYYPFGLQHNGYVGTHRTTGIIEEIGGSNRVGLIPVRNYLDDSYRYTFGGKEEQPELGLNWIDHHARNYMPDLGRWMNVDPLAEEFPTWSLYNYVLNNPLKYTDPTGMAPECDGCKGFVTAMVDNIIGTNLRGKYNTGSASYVNGVQSAHSVSLAVSTFLIVDGVANIGAGSAGLVVSGVAASTGVGTPVAGVTATGSGVLIAKGAAESIVGGVMMNNTMNNMKTDSKSNESSSSRTSNDPLKRDNNGNAKPDSEARGTSHTQLGFKEGRKGKYKQGREFDSNNKPVKDLDFTDHGRPDQHTSPHQHRYRENETGGTRRRGKAEPLSDI